MSLLIFLACQDYNLSTEKPETEEPEAVDSEPYLPPSPDPDIEVSPSSLDFSYVMKDCPSAAQTITITNRGEANLSVSGVSLSGDGASTFVVLDSDVPALETDESHELAVTFTPTAWITYDVTVEIASNDPDEPVVEVALTGTGAEGSYYEESFTQESYSSVDVLWVIDNSGSMSEEIGRLRDNFQTFINAFLSLGMDYHIGVVTTDMDNPSQSGILQGTPAYIDTTTADPVNDFRERADVGAMGSADERGLDAAYAALTDPLMSAENAGFYREDAALAVIVLSDENDYSGRSASSFASWFEALKVDPEMSTFSAIVGDRFLGCTEIDWSTGDTVSASGGDIYIDAADQTGGLFQSICADDFSIAIDSIALVSAGLEVSFPLTYAPTTISSMTVEVDGVVVPYDGSDGWTYDGIDVAIDFHGDAIPDPGSTINVRYPYDSGC